MFSYYRMCSLTIECVILLCAWTSLIINQPCHPGVCVCVRARVPLCVYVYVYVCVCACVSGGGMTSSNASFEEFRVWALGVRV